MAAGRVSEHFKFTCGADVSLVMNHRRDAGATGVYGIRSWTVSTTTCAKNKARIAPDDADDLAVGQRTLVRFTGLHERRLPSLEGRLSRLSADSFTDERTGQSFFTGEVTVPRDQLGLIRAVRGSDFALRAGMPVEVLIPLRKRTALDYALEPLIGSFWSSFREH